METASTRTHHQLTFAVLTLGVGAFALLQSLVMPVLPTLESGLGTTQSDITWVLTAYLLSASIFTPVMGRLGDMHGKKRVFVVALVALAAGSLLAALATSLSVMIAARVIQGIGGGVLPLAFGIIRDEFPEDKVVGAVGIIAALTAVGAGLGIVLAGPIVAVLSYHWLFWIPMIMVVLAGVAAQILVPESRVRTAGKINWLTALLLSGWLVALLLGVSQAPTWGWGSPIVVGLLVAAAVLVATWVVAESRSANPLIDMTMMRIRSVWAANLLALLMGVGMYAAFGFLPQFLQTPTSAGYGFGASVTESGLMLLPVSAGMFLLGLASGRLAARLGSKNLLIAGSLVSAIGYFVVAFLHQTEIDIYLAMSLVGIGFGLAFSAMSNVVVGAVSPEQTGVASGMNANIRTIGGALGAAFMASVVTSGASPTGVPQESGYTHGFLMLGVAVGLGAVAALFIPAMKRDQATHLEASIGLRHPELAMVAGGTLVGDKSE
ncbi:MULTISPECIES: MFS transporter [unclassified Rhodococcus (in: high G+C Gram-positive bacteria)]|uniref:MFS transporter n=1 Tax=unclassified Rhodococcus (in: high G+C Gram-positive bacteria) TaxID=192944 RepID=UPI00163A7E75|nr:MULTISPECIES: MFS transporter [unclassified Rhodococcus (in: high G+C Gram-positive bacteria)]MBC2638115.1 MFS transporter [Rhodococcus sp. 3A]MBC2897140.1 MFS transporter [Rhodococcus sp. 4CII]